jgi:hypothetical protein
MAQLSPPLFVACCGQDLGHDKLGLAELLVFADKLKVPAKALDGVDAVGKAVAKKIKTGVDMDSLTIPLMKHMWGAILRGTGLTASETIFAGKLTSSAGYADAIAAAGAAATAAGGPAFVWGRIRSEIEKAGAAAAPSQHRPGDLSPALFAACCSDDADLGHDKLGKAELTSIATTLKLGVAKDAGAPALQKEVAKAVKAGVALDTLTTVQLKALWSTILRGTQLAETSATVVGKLYSIAPHAEWLAAVALASEAAARAPQSSPNFVWAEVRKALVRYR